MWIPIILISYINFKSIDIHLIFFNVPNMILTLIIYNKYVFRVLRTLVWFPFLLIWQTVYQIAHENNWHCIGIHLLQRPVSELWSIKISNLWPPFQNVNTNFTLCRRNQQFLCHGVPGLRTCLVEYVGAVTAEVIREAEMLFLFHVRFKHQPKYRATIKLW